MTQTQLTVGLGDRAYDITIGPWLIDQAGGLLGEIAAGVTDCRTGFYSE